MQGSLWIQHPAVGDTESPRESWWAGLHCPRGHWEKGYQARAGMSAMIDRAKDNTRSSDSDDPYTKHSQGGRARKCPFLLLEATQMLLVSLLAWSKGKASVPLNKTSSMRPESYH